MERMQFRKDIKATAASVYETMIGRETFRLWTAVFNPFSDFEGGGPGGGWDKGSKVLFVGTDREGKREGMVSYIRENIPGRYVSIEYTGIVDGDNELTEGAVAEEWHGFENYTFESHAGITTVIVEIDVNDRMKDYFLETYPKALDKLREICEV